MTRAIAHARAVTDSLPLSDRRGMELQARFEYLAGRVADLTHEAAQTIPHTSLRAIAQLSRHATAQFDVATGETPVGLAAVVSELERLASDLRHYLHDAQSRRLEGCARALSNLRTTGSVRELVEASCMEATNGCGFGRVVLSRLSGTSWTPHLGHSTLSGELEEWFPGWVGTSITIDRDSPEHEAMTIRRPALVVDTAAPGVHRPLIVDSGRARSYVVAPLICANEVIGLLHADHHADGPRVDEVDRDVLWAFASGLGLLYDRVLLQETLRGQRQQARDVLLSAAESIIALAEREDMLDRPATPASDALGTAWLEALTPRETDVLRLLADGGTNQAIAERLVISPDTVKSHVKNILRKLGVSNRAQAVAVYLRD
ncbi:helix-turn-helix transcriptional regulator [Microbacterium sp. No. 7]|uniref:helix-turn-helix transcriptional regulator n=1 Tax=Microbacterium sp. No. 7 TaxID=1714373 RepID=UPI0006ED13FD|nr:LuxR C-terminal-related transcriptional regulator [Microbacterium sp. No. 7]ALJ21699.1 hypothetical protein AOA12_18100 [Microbacterium sp. No. 7]